MKVTSMPKTIKHAGGRPTKYKPEYAEQAYKLACEGYTDRKIADFFKVRERTINNWKQDHPEFFQSLKKGKDEFDTDVIEQSLAKRASGYQYKEVTKTISKEGKKVTIKEVTKEVAPDPTSIIFWLKNRRPTRWRDKQSEEAMISLEELLAALPKEYAAEVRAKLAKYVSGQN